MTTPTFEQEAREMKSAEEWCKYYMETDGYNVLDLVKAVQTEAELAGFRRGVEAAINCLSQLGMDYAERQIRNLLPKEGE